MEEAHLAMRRQPKLLVSVKNAAEAKLALNAGVDWIDLKNPDAGPLGAPSPSTAAAVAEELEAHDYKSAALGEFCDTDENRLHEIASLFPVAKMGLADCGNSNWENQFSEYSILCQAADCQLVPVVYADWERCNAPSPSTVANFAVNSKSQHLLIDTFHKDERRLLDYLSETELGDLIELLNRQQVSVVVAGQLTWQMTERVIQNFDIYAVAIRGAVCENDRKASLCSRKLEVWVQRFRQFVACNAPNSLASPTTNR